MELLKIILAVYFVLSAMGIVFLIGEERKPITPASALFAILVTFLTVIALLG